MQLYAGMNTICWTQINDTHGFGGIPHNFTTLDECLDACTNMYNTCVAVDWEPSNAGQSCWILTSTATGDSTEIGVITHYELNQPIPGEFTLCPTRLAIKLYCIDYYSITHLLTLSNT